MIRIKSIFKSILIGFSMSVVLLVVVYVALTIFGSESDILHRVTKVLELYVKFLNYGDIEKDNIVTKVTISFLGVVFVSFFSAYITINLLVRKRLKMHKKIVLYEKGKDIWIALFLKNNGAAINSVDISLISYIDGEVRDILREKILNPYIPARNIWRISKIIKRGSFFYSLLRDFERYKCILHVIVKYTDTRTGQRFSNLFIFTKDDIGGINSTKSFYKKRRFETFINEMSLQKEDAENKDFLLINNRLIENNTKIIRMSDVTGICECTEVKPDYLKEDVEKVLDDAYLSSIRQNIKVIINWNNRGENDAFGMALFKFTPQEDWRFFYRSGGKIEFTLFSNGNLKGVSLELKSLKKQNEKKHIDDLMPKVLEEEFNCTKEPKKFCCELDKKVEFIDDLSDIVELCFVVRENQIFDSSKVAWFYICDLTINFKDKKRWE